MSRPLRVFAAGLFAASAAFTAACGRHANSGSDVASQGGAEVGAGSAGDSDAGSLPDGGAVADAGSPPDAGSAADGGPGDGRVRGPRRGRTPRARSLAVSRDAACLVEPNLLPRGCIFWRRGGRERQSLLGRVRPAVELPESRSARLPRFRGQQRRPKPVPRLGAWIHRRKLHARGRQCRLVSGSGGHCLCGRYGCSVVVARSDLRSANWV